MSALPSESGRHNDFGSHTTVLQIPILIEQLRSKYDEERREIEYEVFDHVHAMRLAQAEALDAQSFVLHSMEELTGRLDALETTSVMELRAKKNKSSISSFLGHGLDLNQKQHSTQGRPDVDDLNRDAESMQYHNSANADGGELIDSLRIELRDLRQEIRVCQEEQQLMKAALFNDRLLDEEETDRRLVADEQLYSRIKQAEESSEGLRAQLQTWKSISRALVDNSQLLLQFVDDNHLRHGQQNLLDLQREVLSELAILKRGHRDLTGKIKWLQSTVDTALEEGRGAAAMMRSSYLYGDLGSHKNSLIPNDKEYITNALGTVKSESVATSELTHRTPSRSKGLTVGGGGLVASEHQDSDAKSPLSPATIEGLSRIFGSAAPTPIMRRASNASEKSSVFRADQQTRAFGGPPIAGMSSDERHVRSLRTALGINRQAGGHSPTPSRSSSASAKLAPSTAADRIRESGKKNFWEQLTNVAQRDQPVTSARGQPHVINKDKNPLASRTNVSDLRRCLESFYQIYNPSKIPSIPAILEEYKGAEEELMAALEVHYGAPGYFSHAL